MYSKIIIIRGGPNRIVQSPVSPVVSRLKTGGRKPVFKTPFIPLPPPVATPVDGFGGMVG